MIEGAAPVSPVSHCGKCGQSWHYHSYVGWGIPVCPTLCASCQRPNTAERVPTSPRDPHWSFETDTPDQRVVRQKLAEAFPDGWVIRPGFEDSLNIRALLVRLGMESEPLKAVANPPQDDRANPTGWQEEWRRDHIAGRPVKRPWEYGGSITTSEGANEL